MFLQIALLANIFCDIYLGFDISLQKSFSFLANLTTILLFNFPIALSYTVFSINLYNDFSSLSRFFLLLLFFVCWIQHMILAIEIDLSLIRGVFFIVLIVVLNKGVKFDNGAHTFYYKKVRDQFYNIGNRNIMQKSAIFIW